MKTFEIIYADPPWKYEDKCLHRGGAERYYKTMDIKAICDLPIKSLAAENSILFIWATFPKLIESLQVISAWGLNTKLAHL